MLTITASPRQSSPIPGPRSTAPSRVTRTSISSGNTVSRCADKTTRGRAAAPGRSPRTLPALSTRTLRRPSCWNVCRSTSPRAVSLNGGRGNLAEADLILDRPRLARPGGVERRLDQRVLQQTRPGWPDPPGAKSLASDRGRHEHGGRGPHQNRLHRNGIVSRLSSTRVEACTDDRMNRRPMPITHRARCRRRASPIAQTARHSNCYASFSKGAPP